MSSTTKIPTCDGVGLEVLLVKENERYHPRGVVAIMPGIGYPKEYYLKFALFLADAGFIVAITDYRGQGKSRPENFKNYSINIIDWAMYDMSDVINWLEEKHPNLPLLLIGHSIGGQLIGLLPNHYKIKAAVMIAVSGGYWRWTTKKTKGISLFLWYLFVPLSNFLFGYTKGSLIPGFVDLPKGIASDWRKWCCNPKYLFHYLGKDLPAGKYSDIKFPIYYWRATDDQIATEKNADVFLSHLPNAQLQKNVLTPEELGVKAIGHDQMFKQSFEKTVWLPIRQWLIKKTESF